MAHKGLRYLRNNALGALALFVALGGTSYAATGGFSAASNSIKACAGSGGVLKLQTGKKCRKGQKAVSWNQRGVVGPKGPPGLSGIAALNGAAVPSATKAADATTATTALTATNALALGGTPASGFTHSDCGSETGQIKGYAEVPALPSGGVAFTAVPGYSCSGRAPEVERTGEGVYGLRFPGSPGKGLVATVKDVEAAQFAYPIVVNTGPGEFTVVMFNPTNPPKAENAGFTAMVP